MWFKDFVEKFKLAAKYNGGIGQLALTGDKIRYQFRSFSVVGAEAELDMPDAPMQKTTLSRIAAGAVIAGPVGAIVGGMLKKDVTKGYLTVTLEDGKVLLTDFPASKVTMARHIVNLINEASKVYAD